MNKTRFLSLLLCLCMLCTLILPAAATEGETPEPVSPMAVNKTATANGDGTYTITLEAFATGEKITSQISRDVPTDIILVLDQSGSMDYDMSQYDFRSYQDKSNDDYYNLRHNGGSNKNLYHKLHEEPAGDRYTTVSVTKTVTYSVLNNLTNEDYYDYYQNNLYQKVGEEYQKVTLKYDWYLLFPNEYTYTFADGTTVTSEGDNTKPDFGARGPLYTPNPDDGSTVYTYTYTDKDGVSQPIGTSTGKDTKPTEFILYERFESGSIRRMDAMKNAVNLFVNSVKKKAMGQDGAPGTQDDINHRIAVVGFASKSGNGNNTELLSISGNNSGSVGVRYGQINDQYLKDVLQNMNTSAGQNMVNAAINALDTEGATEINLGMDMANRILNANPVSAGENRNRVVIVFTDGSPTASNGFELNVANSAINQASAIKGRGATVYSIGIFEGANAGSAGSKPSGNLSNNSSRLPEANNWFMQNLSSNNGVVRYPSYYLSASDAHSLNSIFKQIAQQIEEGGSATELGEEAVVKDFISPYFQLRAGATAKDITLNTYPCTGKNGNQYTWGTAASADGVNATIGQNGEVSVTGFNFSENWCGLETKDGTQTPHGNKLEISFTVERKPAFLGGNDVPTNDLAGVYKNAADTVPEFAFPVPIVNVPIGDVSVQAQDKNVYLLDNVTADELKYGATVKVGGVTLDLTKANDPDKPYGLDEWQMEHVDITVTIQDENGNTIADADLQKLKDDVSYTIQVAVSPKTDGLTAKGTPATAQTNSGNAKINVFMPELTFKDLEGYYGAIIPNDTENPTKEEWKHGETVAVQGTTIIGPKPVLTIRTGYDRAMLDAKGRINTKRDIPVKAEVNIGETLVNQYTTFKHEACTSGCSWTDVDTPNGDPAFLIHVKTCTLKVTKTGGAAGEPYVFTVKKDGTAYTEVTIEGNGTQTIVELPVGTYTIAEDTGWSWRYTPSYSDDVTLSATAPEGTITCTNTSNNNKWLNGFSSVVRNVFATATNN